MGKKSKPKPSNGDVLYALKMAVPLAIASRFDGFAHCVEASVAGANALREFGFKTATAPCAVRLVNNEAASTMTIGYTPRQIYDNMKATPENLLPPFEEWQKAYAAAVPDEEAPMHQIIWAKSDGETFLIDLTIAQLREPRGPGWDSLRRNRSEQQASIAAPVVTDATAPALLGMSPRQFRTAITRQRVPYMKLGQRTVVFFVDLQRLAHQNASVSEAHPEPRDRHNRRLAADTEVDDFMASIEHLDERDAVNAILGRLGRQMTDEAYRNYKPRKP